MDRATSLVRALDLLSFLGGVDRSYSVQNMADAMNQPRSTVVRILNTLVEYGLVEKSGRQYFCSESFELWAQKNRHQAFRLRYRQVLESVAAATGELVLLGVLDGAGIVHIDFIESDEAVRVAPAPHTRHNIRRNALGKLVLAQRDDLAERWVAGDPAFAVELEEIRTSGFAWNREESVSGMIAMASYGRLRSTTEPMVAVAWPVQRFDEAKGEAAAQAIRSAISKMS